MSQRTSKEMEERMKYLIDNQQFSIEIRMDECWVCGSKLNLVFHHVKYFPSSEAKVLCRSCHQKLHISFLKKQKCLPSLNVYFH